MVALVCLLCVVRLGLLCVVCDGCALIRFVLCVCVMCLCLLCCCVVCWCVLCMVNLDVLLCGWCWCCCFRSRLYVCC